MTEGVPGSGGDTGKGKPKAEEAAQTTDPEPVAAVAESKSKDVPTTSSSAASSSANGQFCHPAMKKDAANGKPPHTVHIESLPRCLYVLLPSRSQVVAAW